MPLNCAKCTSKALDSAYCISNALNSAKCTSIALNSAKCISIALDSAYCISNARVITGRMSHNYARDRTPRVGGVSWACMDTPSLDTSSLGTSSLGRTYPRYVVPRTCLLSEMLSRDQGESPVHQLCYWKYTEPYLTVLLDTANRQCINYATGREIYSTVHHCATGGQGDSTVGESTVHRLCYWTRSLLNSTSLCY